MVGQVGARVVPKTIEPGDDSRVALRLISIGKAAEASALADRVDAAVASWRELRDQVRAEVAAADARIEIANAAEQAARTAQREQADANRLASEALAGRERTLKGERDRHEANVTASTMELQRTLELATERQRQASLAETQNVARAAGLDARANALAEREADLNQRETVLNDSINAARKFLAIPERT